jgi:hypothetical protein
LDDRLTLVLATAIGAVASAIIVRGLDVYQRWQQDHTARQRLVTALATEIHHNIADIERFTSQAWSVPHILGVLAEDRRRRLLVPVTRNMTFFDILKNEMGSLPSGCLDETVAFYSTLEKIYAQAALLRSAEFQRASRGGQEVALRRFLETMDEAARAGRIAVDGLHTAFPHLVTSSALRGRSGHPGVGSEHAPSPRAPSPAPPRT